MIGCRCSCSALALWWAFVAVPHYLHLCGPIIVLCRTDSPIVQGSFVSLLFFLFFSLRFSFLIPGRKVSIALPVIRCRCTNESRSRRTCWTLRRVPTARLVCCLRSVRSASRCLHSIRCPSRRCDPNWPVNGVERIPCSVSFWHIQSWNWWKTGDRDAGPVGPSSLRESWEIRRQYWTFVQKSSLIFSRLA